MLTRGSGDGSRADYRLANSRLDVVWNTPVTYRVHAIIPTYARPRHLAQALASLLDQGPELASVIVVNNSSDSETAHVVEEAGTKVRLLDFGCNLGTAGGIAAGMREVLADTRATHVWILDDDGCATPGVLATMLVAGERARADAVAPLLLDATGVVRWFPGPLPQPMWNLVRQHPGPEEVWARCGDEPQACRWAYWASLLISRRAVETLGFPRMDLWSQFTDMEYTLRLTARFKAVLAPRAVCRHLPPPSDALTERRKRESGLQSSAYVSVWLRHGWRALRHLPGIYYRALRGGRWRPEVWKDAGCAFVRGALLARTPADGAYREAFLKAHARFPEWRDSGVAGPRPRTATDSS